MSNIPYGSTPEEGAKNLTPAEIAAIEAKKDGNTAEEEGREDALAKKRALRAGRSVEGFDNPFDIPKEYLRAGFHYFIANDSPGRIQRLLNRGYEHCRDEGLATYLGLKIGEPIKFATGHPQNPWAYLMMIETELYLEDQRAVDELAAEKMAELENADEGLSFTRDAEVSGLTLKKVDPINK